jgi:meiotically up-regulated gene 157 (Mug157) protein
MVKTGFRPSDDPNELPYNVPGNAMASVFLRKVADDILSKIDKTSVFYSQSQNLINKMKGLADQMKEGIYKHAIITKNNKQILAYEIDGFGNYRLYDDANLPSLISLPYF